MDRRGFLATTGKTIAGLFAAGGVAALVDSGLAEATRPRGRIALTFDDGPGKGSIAVRQILEDAGVHGTWFLVGNQVVRGPGIVQGLANNGHGVQNHSWSHQDLTKLADPRPEITKCSDAIANAIGRRPQCIRPPYGATNDNVRAVISELGMSSVFWSLSWQRNTAAVNPVLDMILEAEARRDKGASSTVLFHDVTNDSEWMIPRLPGLIAAFKALNYEFFAYN